jgi:hypothetical protein
MKKKILSDVKITCEPPEKYFYFKSPTMEDWAEYYEKWVKEFHNFIKDHRSQDPVRLNVEKEYKEVCEFCGMDWETDEDNSPVCCQEAINEFVKDKLTPPTKLGVRD